MLVCAPLRIEARALRAGLDRGAVLRTGRGPDRSTRSAAALASREEDLVVVAGLGGGLVPELRSGAVVVGDELRGRSGTVHCGSAASLAEHLRRASLRVHRGPVVSTDHVVLGAERAALARTGALAVDTESAELAQGVGDRPLAVVRVLLDTPDEPLIAAGFPRRLHRALHVLRLLGAPLDRWSHAALGRGTTTSVHTGEELQ